MELLATFNKSNFPKEYTPWMGTITLGGEYVLREKSLQHIGLLPLTTAAPGITANASANPTYAAEIIVLRRITNYEVYLFDAEDTSGLSVSCVSLFDLSSLGEATETHICTKYVPSRLLFGTLENPVVQLISGLFAPPESSWMTTQVIREEQETIRADIAQALSFKDLVNALDRISRPTEIEDIPLPFDPDDYPVV